MGAHAYTHGVIHEYVKFDMPEITGVFQVGCLPQDLLQEICCLTVSRRELFYPLQESVWGYSWTQIRYMENSP